ncbi:MAG: hypothetical protein DHS20C13_11960 [Thermodesulfobacteriota bacterium]|nr:MAG: hypothetical protein DHS20C13_11960 [Thermodesulfobacteriota bacterium]
MFLMNNIIYEQKRIHLSELDEYLASRFLDKQSALRFTMSRNDLQGYVTIKQEKNEQEIEERGIDFELSPSEYQSLNSINILDFTNQTIYTSSAYEFFDFMLMYFYYLEYLVDFTGSSWRVKILGFKEVK